MVTKGEKCSARGSQNNKTKTMHTDNHCTNNHCTDAEPQEQAKKQKPDRLISGFWRRLFAFIIDASMLGAFGFIAGKIFFDFFAGTGAYGRLIGFVVALLYFGLLNSSIAHGQTIGKRILKIRVVDRNRQTLSPARSLVRFLILGLPFFLNGAMIPPEIMLNTFASVLIGVMFFFLGGSIVYLYIFNNGTRQSLHDLVVGSYVIKTGSTQEMITPSVWRGHFAVLGLIFAAVIVFTTIVVPGVMKTESFSRLYAVQKGIRDTGLVHAAAVSAGTIHIAKTDDGENEKTGNTYLSINAVLKERPTDYDRIINIFAFIVMDKYASVMEKDSLVVNVAYGYDIGISHSWIRQGKQLSPEEWKKQLSKYPYPYR